MPRLSAALRRRAPKPPLGAALVYRSALRRALRAQQARLWAIIERSYVELPPAVLYQDTGVIEYEVRLSTGQTWRGDAPADGGRAEMRQTHVELPPKVLDVVGGRVSKKTRDEAKRVAGITRASQGADDSVIGAFRRRNLGLIRTLEAKQVDELGEVLDLATREGWPIDRLRRAVEERFEVARSHADLLARDQTLKLNAQLSQMRQTSVGITEYVWSTSNDERVREEHAELDGQRFSWTDPPASGPNGERWHPGEGYQCRCVAIAVVPWLEEE